MNKQTLIFSGIIVLAVVLALFFFKTPSSNKYGNLDKFAQCLADKKITMYGAYWCSHCKAQKALFGDSWKYVPYVECTENEKECLAKEIEGYPTWIFLDGKKLSGEQSLETLSVESGCLLQ